MNDILFVYPKEDKRYVKDMRHTSNTLTYYYITTYVICYFYFIKKTKKTV